MSATTRNPSWRTSVRGEYPISAVWMVDHEPASEMAQLWGHEPRFEAGTIYLLLWCQGCRSCLAVRKYEQWYQSSALLDVCGTYERVDQFHDGNITIRPGLVP